MCSRLPQDELVTKKMHLTWTLATSMFLSACEKPSNLRNSEIIENSEKIIFLNRSLRLNEIILNRIIKVEENYKIHNRDTIAQKNEIINRKKSIVILKADISKVDQELKNYISQRNEIMKRKRLSAISQKYDVFTSMERDYYQVFVTAVDPQGVEIEHKYGRARVRVEHLSREQIEHFGLDPDEALIHREAEKKRSEAFAFFVEKSIQQNEQMKKITSQKLELNQNTTSNIENYRKRSLFESSKNKEHTIYRLRNQGKPTYYYVNPYPSEYCPLYHFHDHNRFKR